MSDEFFVGYLKTPVGLRRFLRSAALVVLLTGITLAVALAASQRDPGDGVWDLAHAKTLEGVAYTTPCPLIRIAGRDGTAMTVLLVGQGKVGAAARIAADGHAVRVRGHALERGRVRMFELDGDAGAIEELPADIKRLAMPVTSRRWAVLLHGEIADPKCFAGAMKPGDGKTHKGCAALCLRGGIPAIFVADDGQEYLLADAAGRSPSGAELDGLLPFVGDLVEISGEVEVRGDLRLLTLSGAVKRL